MSNDNTTASRRGFLGGLTAVGAAEVPAAARALGGLPTSTAGQDAPFHIRWPPPLVKMVISRLRVCPEPGDERTPQENVRI